MAAAADWWAAMSSQTSTITRWVGSSWSTSSSTERHPAQPRMTAMTERRNSRRACSFAGAARKSLIRVMGTRVNSKGQRTQKPRKVQKAKVKKTVRLSLPVLTWNAFQRQEVEPQMNADERRSGAAFGPLLLSAFICVHLRFVPVFRPESNLRLNQHPELPRRATMVQQDRAHHDQHRAHDPTDQDADEDARFGSSPPQDQIRDQR